ncbi:MAG: CCA tRNA nucleotidyltransferase, partial [Dehalococcoidia bacterium]
LKSGVPAQILGVLQEIGGVAEGRDERVYAVGGVIRDLLLRRPVLDLDLVIEGKAIPLAWQIAKAGNWQVRTHPHFGTAKLLADDFTIDFATARSETYAYPGALPTVEWGTINEDLFRRDFTINAMAASLIPESFGDVLDPHGGQRDLEEGLIRILHPGSFSDDPTRILRAIRYEQRFDFRLEEDTEQVMQQDMDILDNVTGERLWHDLELILEEERPEKVLCRAYDLGALQHLCPATKGDAWLRDKFARCRSNDDHTLHMPTIYLCLMIYRLSEEETQTCISRLKMPGWAKRAVQNTVELRDSAAHLSTPKLRPSQIYREVERYSPEAIAAAALASESHIVQERLDLYLDVLRYVKCSLSGDDLKRMGIEEGKRIGQILRTIHDARLDGEVVNRQEEEQLVRRMLAEENR